MMKPKMHVLVGEATHFLKWEMPHYERHFEIVPEPAADAILLVFGPDVLDRGAALLARRLVAKIFPGFRHHPVHQPDVRRRTRSLIDARYDLVFVNPGPLSIAYRGSPKLSIVPIAIDVGRLRARGFRPRTAIDSLVHVSNHSPQKDRPRNAEIMALTGLPHEMFPPVGVPRSSHDEVIGKYMEHDGFVHVAGRPHPHYLDGKYTTCILEAGATGAILFWHNTIGAGGNEFETVFEVPLDPQLAAEEILRVRDEIDVEEHSRRTREEILRTCDPEKTVAVMAERIKELL